MDIRLLDESRPFAEINIIPFVDIILVVLIIFMLAAPTAMKGGLPLDLPEAGSSAPVKSQPRWHFSILATGEVALNNQIMSLKDIQKHIERQISSTKPGSGEGEHQALISADKNVLHGKVVSVINTLSLLGIKKISIVTKKQKTP